MKSIGFPLVSDSKYGSKTRVRRQMATGRGLECGRLFLHCAALGLPDMEARGVRTFCALSPDLRPVVERLLRGDACDDAVVGEARLAEGGKTGPAAPRALLGA